MKIIELNPKYIYKKGKPVEVIIDIKTFEKVAITEEKVKINASEGPVCEPDGKCD